MTTSHRKKHFIIWSLLLILTPTFFYLATQQKISYLSNKKINKGTFPVHFKVEHRRLQVDVYTPFSSPAALLYLITEDKEIFLGEITQRAHYQFSIPKKHEGIKVIDAFNKKVLFESQL